MSMGRLQRFSLLCMLTDELRSQSSWGGETHLQKSVFLFRDLAGVPSEYEFTLYKHGPFSFELRNELNEMLAFGILALHPNPYPYGPSFEVTPSGRQFQSRFPKTSAKYRAAVEFVARAVGEKNAVELERMSTALLVTRERPGLDDEKVAHLVTELKPHVSFAQALQATSELREIQDSWNKGS